MSFEAKNLRPRRPKLIRALIRKDARLLRFYLRSAIATIIACYLLAGMVVMLSQYQDAAKQSLTSRTFFTLAVGSIYGIGITGFFAALLAGSVFTLERSDRSAEFLACLPPTRLQNLVSKLTVVLGATTAMLALPIISSAVANQMFPYVQVAPGQGNILFGTPEWLTSVAIIVSIIGGAFAVSAWLKSNGVPILAGLLTPLLILSFVSLIGWLLDIPSEGNAFQIRYVTSSFVLGVAFAYMGCYWYLTRSDP